MSDIKNPKLLYLKGGMFVLLGVLASGLLLYEHFSWKVAFLLSVAVWAFARAYYFAFYVIEHYVDDGFKFAGLWAFFRYAIGRERGGGRGNESG